MLARYVQTLLLAGATMPTPSLCMHISINKAGVAYNQGVSYCLKSLFLIARLYVGLDNYLCLILITCRSREPRRSVGIDTGHNRDSEYNEIFTKVFK